MEFRDIYAMVKVLEEYEKIELSQSFYQWSGDAYVSFIQSEVYASLMKETVSLHRLFDKKIFLAKKMMYEAIPEEYIQDDDQWHISRYEKMPLSQFDSFRAYLAYYYLLDESDFLQEGADEKVQMASPKQIKEMIATNPAIATLIEKFGIDVEDNNDCPF